MARACMVCTHKLRKEIDEALLLGTLSFRQIQAQYGISSSSVKRHKDKGHIKAKAKAIAEIKGIRESKTFLDKSDSLEKIILDTITEATAAGDLKAKCAAIREYRATIEMSAKATGEITERHEITGKDGQPIDMAVTLNIAEEVRKVVKLLPDLQH